MYVVVVVAVVRIDAGGQALLMVYEILFSSSCLLLGEN